MKKIDYQTLAHELREDLLHVKRSRENTSDAATLHALDYQISTLEALAYRLANRLHVDTVAFLTACGV